MTSLDEDSSASNNDEETVRKILGGPPSVFGPLLAAFVIILIEATSRLDFKFPNPPAILMTICVFSAFTGGMRMGLLTAVITVTYYLGYYATPHGLSTTPRMTCSGCLFISSPHPWPS